MTYQEIRDQINALITENNPGAPKDVLEQKLEDVDEIEKAKEELIEIIKEL